ncbi:MAG: monovalent cation/H(+) antiporter subunit G [Erysipelotrichaceae bacterium]|nr:monovalent cation/H(+) antiporter subunit G [Erysipelotrichaceae bacterium]
MIRLILASIFLLSGIFCVAVSVLGLFRFNYVLNRMHAASIADTLGLFLSVIGLMLLAENCFHLIRLGLAIIFLWMASPVCSHLIARTEVLTNEKVNERIGRK